MFKTNLLNNIFWDWQKMLNFLERFESIHPVYDIFPKSIKIALVKQYVYADLYSKTFINHENVDEIINSSNHRTGPVGLFKKFHTDFYIVDVDENDPECNVYKEKGENKSWIEISKKQQKHSIKSEDVNWSNYDLVICIENAVPYETVIQHKHKTLWATMLETHTMPSYRKYLNKPPKGYDLFFNQQFGPSPFNIVKKKHIIDWSYSFNLNTNQYLEKTKSIMVETHTSIRDKSEIENINGFEIYHSNQNIKLEKYTEILKSVKYLILPISTSEKVLTGNITIEAAANGVLILGNKNFIWNSFIICNSCHVKSIKKLKQMIEKLESDTNLHQKLLEEQSRRLNYFVFSRPLIQISKKMNSILQ